MREIYRIFIISCKMRTYKEKYVQMLPVSQKTDDRRGKNQKERKKQNKAVRNKMKKSKKRYCKIGISML